MQDRQRVFSGVQPAGRSDLGSCLGALETGVSMQDGHDCLFSIVDLHALTVPQDPKVLRANVHEMAALYVAVGLDPEKSTIFRQSRVSEHTELAWLLNCVARVGELSRMTQFKDKAQKGGADSASVGLYEYPVLQAADVLLYNAHLVPVGEDQRQHLELMRTLARRFNGLYGETFVVPAMFVPPAGRRAGPAGRGRRRRLELMRARARRFNGLYGETFVVPEMFVPPAGARVMALDEPTAKMSKSSPTPASYVAILDEPDVVRRKIRRAKTDSGTEITASQDKPAITNLLDIYASATGRAVPELEEEYRGKGAGALTTDPRRAA